MTRYVNIICALCINVWLAACSSNPPESFDDYPQPVFTAERILPENYDLLPIYDPWRSFNIRVYNFNYEFDRLVFLPALDVWEKYVPGFARTGVKNFYRNITDVNTMFNSALQLNPDKFLSSTGRVFVNSTIGLLGLVDIASRIDIPRTREDFGQTLGHWGVGRGPYLVIPLLGPSNLRDAIGLVPDFYVESLAQGLVLSDPLRTATFAVEAVDTRANTSFRYYETGFTFEYRMMRWLYSTVRDLDAAN